MTQTTLPDYNERIKSLIKEQRNNVKCYNMRKTKQSKLKYMESVIIPLEVKIDSLK